VGASFFCLKMDFKNALLGDVEQHKTIYTKYRL